MSHLSDFLLRDVTPIRSCLPCILLLLSLLSFILMIDQHVSARLMCMRCVQIRLAPRSSYFRSDPPRCAMASPAVALPLGASSASAETPPPKLCSSCSTLRAVSEFSGNQLKKKGRRVCTPCITNTPATAPSGLSYIIPLTPAEVMSRSSFRVLVGSGYTAATRVTDGVDDVPAGHCRVRYDRDGVVEDVSFAPVCPVAAGTPREGGWRLVPTICILWPRFDPHSATLGSRGCELLGFFLPS